MLHADVNPTLVEVGPGESCSFLVTITNSSPLIDAYSVTLFGLDPTWVGVDQPRLSLFPDESGVVAVTIALPESFPAGHRQLSVHVRSENDPSIFALASLGMLSMGQHRVRMRIDPVVVNGGSEASFGLVLNNDGNSTITAIGSGVDPEEMATITLAPGALALPPGHQDVIQTTVVAKRPWFGQPKVRIITFAVDTPVRLEGIATFIQKPRISRWLLSLMGLLAAAAVFAVVLSSTFENVIDEASVDKGLLTEALNDGDEGGATVPVDPGGVAGKVILFSTGNGVAGVQADLYSADDTKMPIATAATDDEGAYSFGRLNAGKFKVRFTGAGFNEVWYESGTTAADATDVEVELGMTKDLDDVKLGGRPGSIAGTVDADDLTDITATLVVPGTVLDDVEAQVLTLDVSADGTFLFEDVPSPATYQLIVAKSGYATETRDVAMGPAQSIDNIEIVLRKGDGTIRGSITDANGPLGGATIEATDGINKISSVSLTETDVGAFALRSLATPQIYTLTISRPGYRTETRTVSLDMAQEFDLSSVVLQRSTGSIGGTVSQIGVGPIGGVQVTISAGDSTLTTFTSSTGVVGSYLIDRLPIPATYTLSFSKPGLVDQVRVQDLDPAATPDVLAIDVALPRSTATVAGIVRGVDNSPVPLATVTLSDGTIDRVLSSANDPIGQFSFSNVVPGAYTVTATLPGTSSAVELVTVVSDTDRFLDIRLQAQASVTGQVLLLSTVTATTTPATTPATTTTTTTTTTLQSTTTTAPGPPTSPGFLVEDVSDSVLSLTAQDKQQARADLRGIEAAQAETASARLVPVQAVQVAAPSAAPSAAPPGTYLPYAGAIVRLYLAPNFPGPPTSAVATAITDANGLYSFEALEAPENYVVAVFQTATSPDPLESKLVVTQPSTRLTVPTFEIPVLF